MINTEYYKIEIKDNEIKLTVKAPLYNYAVENDMSVMEAQLVGIVSNIKKAIELVEDDTLNPKYLEVTSI